MAETGNHVIEKENRGQRERRVNCSLNNDCDDWISDSRKSLNSRPPHDMIALAGSNMVADSSPPPLVSTFKMFTSWMLLSIRAPPLSIKLAINSNPQHWIHSHQRLTCTQVNEATHDKKRTRTNQTRQDTDKKRTRTNQSKALLFTGTRTLLSFTSTFDVYNIINTRLTGDVLVL